MENGYLGGAITAATFLLLALAYRQFRRPGAHWLVDNETAVTAAGLAFTITLSLGFTIFVGNALITDLFSTAVSSVVVLASMVALGLTIARTKTAPVIQATEPYSPAPFTPDTPPANSNDPLRDHNSPSLKVA